MLRSKTLTWTQRAMVEGTGIFGSHKTVSWTLNTLMSERYYKFVTVSPSKGYELCFIQSGSC